MLGAPGGHIHSFFHQHDRYVFPNGVDDLTGRAGKTRRSIIFFHGGKAHAAFVFILFLVFIICNEVELKKFTARGALYAAFFNSVCINNKFLAAIGARDAIFIVFLIIAAITIILICKKFLNICTEASSCIPERKLT